MHHHRLLHPSAQIRHLSSNSHPSPFPFPRHPNPSPWEIFDLPRSASQAEIKERYFALVKVHHPDAPTGNARNFHAVRGAYDALRGRRVVEHDEAMREVLRRKRWAQHRRGAAKEGNWAGERAHPHRVDDAWKDHAILGFGLLCLVFGAFQPLFAFPYNARHREASRNLAQARKDALEERWMWVDKRDGRGREQRRGGAR